MCRHFSFYWPTLGRFSGCCNHYISALPSASLFHSIQVLHQACSGSVLQKHPRFGPRQKQIVQAVDLLVGVCYCPGFGLVRQVQLAAVVQEEHPLAEILFVALGTLHARRARAHDHVRLGLLIAFHSCLLAGLKTTSCCSRSALSFDLGSSAECY